MKKTNALFCILITISIILCSCSNTAKNDSILFYYCSAQENYSTTGQAIQYEKHNTTEPLAYSKLLSVYLDGPRSSNLTSPFPEGTKLVRCSLEQQIVQIVLNDQFSKLTGIELSIACACLCLTAENITGCAQVQISAENMTLDGKDSITLNANNLILLEQTP